MKKRIYDIVDKNEYIFEFLHSNPELSFKEYKTTDFIKKYCLDRGVKIIESSMKTGAIGFLDVNSKNTVALRADIDAIATENGPKHLCGHDAHTASLLCALDFLSSNKDLLKSNVLFIFQPAEEVTLGAKEVMDSGFFDKLKNEPSLIFGIHNRPEIPIGKIAVHKGSLMAQKSNFTLEYFGKTGHGGQPHQCIDPIIAAAEFTSSLQSIISRNVDPLEPAVCSVCSIHGGSTENFAPENVVLTGSIRTLNENIHSLCTKRVDELAKNIAKAFNCDYKIEIKNEVPLLYNDEELYNVAYKIAEQTVGKSNVIDTQPCLGSEDFSVYSKYMKSFFYWVGNGNEGSNNSPWHNKDFKILDGYIKNATELYVNLALVKLK